MSPGYTILHRIFGTGFYTSSKCNVLNIIVLEYTYNSYFLARHWNIAEIVYFNITLILLFKITQFFK